MTFQDKIVGCYLRAATVVALALLIVSPARALYFESISTVSVSNQSVTVILPKTGMSASELAVIVNDADPQSVEVANYYRVQKKIPKKI